jgi:hypothetical protein
LGATPIGSAGRAPDEVLKRRKRNSDLFFQEDDEQGNTSEHILGKIRL